MSTGLKIAVVFGLLLLLGGGSCVGYALSVRSSAVTHEAGVKASHDRTRSTLAKGATTLMEVAQVPTMYKDDMVEVMGAEMGAGGRYGNNGKQALMNWVQERQLNFDSSLYKKIQQVSEAVRADFDADQKMKIDRIQIYEAWYKQLGPSIVLKFWGFPSEDFKKHSVIVTSDYTEESFSKGKAEAIKLR